jgi:hypothetical protein
MIHVRLCFCESCDIVNCADLPLEGLKRLFTNNNNGNLKGIQEFEVIFSHRSSQLALTL